MSCYTVVYWGVRTWNYDTPRLDRLERRTGSLVDTELDSVAKRRTLDKVISKAHHPLQIGM